MFLADGERQVLKSQWNRLHRFWLQGNEQESELHRTEKWTLSISLGRSFGKVGLLTSISSTIARIMRYSWRLENLDCTDKRKE